MTKWTKWLVVVMLALGLVTNLHGTVEVSHPKFHCVAQSGGAYNFHFCPRHDA